MGVCNHIVQQEKLHLLFLLLSGTKLFLLFLLLLRFWPSNTTTGTSNCDQIDDNNRIDGDFINRVHGNRRDGIDCDNNGLALFKTFDERNDGDGFDDCQFTFVYNAVEKGDNNGVLDDQ